MKVSVDNAELTLIAKKEIQNSTTIDALWRKALALTGGDKSKAEAKYIKLRILDLKKNGIPKSSKKNQPKAKIEKEEINTKVDTSYEEKRISEIDDALNKKNQKEKSKSNNNTLKGVILMLTIFAVFIWIVNINNSQNSYQTKYSLSIITPNLEDTNIKILNSYNEYYDEIRLEKGWYNIEVSHPGYQTKKFEINLLSNTEKIVYLEKGTDPYSKFSVSIDTIPKNATVKIMNIKPKFYQGMRLKKGRYNLQISKQGYETDKSYFILENDSSYSVTLKKKATVKYPLTINTIPYDAKIQITNIKPKYYDGMQLKKGKYFVKISKKGYKTKVTTVYPHEKEIYNFILTENIKGSVTHNNLIWQDNNEVGKIQKDWDEAKYYCKDLRLDGFKDWFLPTKKQLTSLMKSSVNLQNNINEFTWSASEYRKDNTQAWAIKGNGDSTWYSKHYEDNVRCVRYKNKGAIYHESSSSNTVSGNKYKLNIDTHPVNATVSILNIQDRYFYGMSLKKGSYEVQISANGYKSKQKWVELTENTDLYFQLEKNSYNRSTVVNAKACTSCHGKYWNKRALGKSKVVSNMSSYDIAMALKGYKNGTYGGPMKGLMKGQVAKYSDYDLEVFAKTIGR